MESLARTVALLWVLSIALALTALLFAILYNRGKATIKGATFWLIASAADIIFYLYRSWRFVVIQLFIWAIAFVITARTRRARS